jgi:hypothetical protein
VLLIGSPKAKICLFSFLFCDRYPKSMA